MKRRNAGSSGQKYIDQCVVLLAVFFLALPFFVTIHTPVYLRYLWYTLPLITLYMSVMAHKSRHVIAIHSILFSLIGIVTAIMFAALFANIV